MKVRYLLTLLLLPLAACTAHQEMEQSTVIISDHLSNQRVNAFAQDPDGHIWLATGRGLDKFDSHDYYQYYCSDDTLSLPDNQVSTVFIQRSGRLWAGTMNGAAWRTDQDRFHRIRMPGDSRNVTAILEDREGNLLLQGGSKLFRYDEARDTVVTVIRELSAFGSPALALDRNNRLWVNNGASVTRYDAADFTQSESVPTPFICYHLCDAGNDELWLSGMGGLGILDTRTMEWKPLPEAIRRTGGIMDGDVDLIYAVDSRTLLLHVIGKGMYR